MFDVEPAARARPYSALADAVARLIPATALAYPLIIWPLVYVVPSHAEFAAGDVQIEATPLNRVFFPPLFALAVACCVANRPRLTRASTTLLVLVSLFLALGAASILWALSPEIAARRITLQVAIVGSIVASLLSLRSPKDALGPVFWMLAVALAMNVAALPIRPAGPLGHEGIYAQKNELGAVAAVAAIVACWRLREPGRLGRATAFVALAAAAALLVLSQSKTSLMLLLFAPALAAIFCALARLARISGAATGAGVTCLVILALAVAEQAFLVPATHVADLLIGDATFTRRDEIWAFAIAMLGDRPALGYGFQSFWGIGPEAPSVREAPGFVAQMPDAHNGYIDLLLQLGLAGALVVVPLLLVALHVTTRTAVREPRLAFLSTAVLVFVLLHNLLETTLFRGFSAMSMAFLALAFIAAQRSPPMPSSR